MSTTPESTRTRLLRAAQDIARDIGPASVSLDAVAARAGVSKGGLLYHFPTKAALLRALVEDQLAQFDAALTRDGASDAPDGVLAAYIDTFVALRLCAAPPGAGMLAALVEDPAILEPARRHERRFLDAIRANAGDPDRATLAYLALHGIALMRLLDIGVLEGEELDGVIAALRGAVHGAADQPRRPRLERPRRGAS